MPVGLCASMDTSCYLRVSPSLLLPGPSLLLLNCSRLRHSYIPPTQTLRIVDHLQQACNRLVNIARDTHTHAPIQAGSAVLLPLTPISL